MLLRTDVGVLEKQHAATNFEKVNAVAAHGSTSNDYESKLEDKANYMDRQLAGFRAQGQGNQGQNYVDKYRDHSKERDGDWRKKDDYKKKVNRYIPPGIRDIESKIKEIWANLVKGQKKLRDQP